MRLAWLDARPVRRTTGGLLVVAVAAQVAHATVGLGSGWIDGFVNPGLYCATLVCAALVCLIRAVRAPGERLPWSLLAVGLGSWAAADIYWVAFLANLDAPPYPSLADAGYLVLYPTCYAAVLLLIARGGLRLPRSMWLDGAIGALGMAAIASALLFRPILDASLGRGRDRHRHQPRLPDRRPAPDRRCGRRVRCQRLAARPSLDRAGRRSPP